MKTHPDLAPGTLYRCVRTGRVHRVHGVAYNRVTMQQGVVHQVDGGEPGLLYIDSLANFARDFEKLPVETPPAPLAEERVMDLSSKGSF